MASTFPVVSTNTPCSPFAPISGGGRQVTAFARIQTDFAITDLHPDELQATQRVPHTDPVPIFGLVYLNEVDRGGTMFFRNAEGAPPAGQREGYFTSQDSGFEFVGKIEGIYNRLAIYPGFVPHSGEISGDWISTGMRVAVRPGAFVGTTNNESRARPPSAFEAPVLATTSTF